MSDSALDPSPVAGLYGRMSAAAHQVLLGQDDVFKLLVVALCAGGHVLLEGVPGTAKTLMAKLLAQTVDAEFRRIQFTPDLMPSDIVGTTVFDLQTGAFHLRRGPIFTQILLADEINRAPAKTQAALLEAMEEQQVSLEGTRHPLPDPFFVIATQNPVEYEGTYPLPEAQLDRFLFKVAVPYPPLEDERDVLRRYDGGTLRRSGGEALVQPVVSPSELATMRTLTTRITVDDSIIQYITDLVDATRHSPDLALGASPRASIALLLSSKVLAAVEGRSYVTPDDVKLLAGPVLRHRLILRPEAEIEGVTADRFIERLLARVPVPR